MVKNVAHIFFFTILSFFNKLYVYGLPLDDPYDTSGINTGGVYALRFNLVPIKRSDLPTKFVVAVVLEEALHLNPTRTATIFVTSFIIVNIVVLGYAEEITGSGKEIIYLESLNRVDKGGSRRRRGRHCYP
ncbi:hypothetical protein L6452_32774 [Arctium lappa]|uniref:Uncharacterized protein n=1 Tax=Arctium lappa TaxID=4217 RepID=A0ACB8Z6R7_ARCLA|nr:hypothetical protein L6452_32774 [Arctium lappa]